MSCTTLQQSSEEDIKFKAAVNDCRLADVLDWGKSHNNKRVTKFVSAIERASAICKSKKIISIPDEIGCESTEICNSRISQLEAILKQLEAEQHCFNRRNPAEIRRVIKASRDGVFSDLNTKKMIGKCMSRYQAMLKSQNDRYRSVLIELKKNLELVAEQEKKNKLRNQFPYPSDPQIIQTVMLELIKKNSDDSFKLRAKSVSGSDSPGGAFITDNEWYDVLSAANQSTLLDIIKNAETIRNRYEIEARSSIDSALQFVSSISGKSLPDEESAKKCQHLIDYYKKQSANLPNFTWYTEKELELEHAAMQACRFIGICWPVVDMQGTSKFGCSLSRRLHVFSRLGRGLEFIAFDGNDYEQQSIKAKPFIIQAGDEFLDGAGDYRIYGLHYGNKRIDWYGGFVREVEIVKQIPESDVSLIVRRFAAFKFDIERRLGENAICGYLGSYKLRLACAPKSSDDAQNCSDVSSDGTGASYPIGEKSPNFGHY